MLLLQSRKFACEVWVQCVFKSRNGMWILQVTDFDIFVHLCSFGSNGMRLNKIRWFLKWGMIWRMRRANSLLNGAYTVHGHNWLIFCVWQRWRRQRRRRFQVSFFLHPSRFNSIVFVFAGVRVRSCLFHRALHLNANYLRWMMLTSWMSELRFCWSVHRFHVWLFIVSLTKKKRLNERPDQFMYAHDIALSSHTLCVHSAKKKKNKTKRTHTVYSM